MYTIPSPDQIELIGPDDESPVWWNEPANGRHALVLGDLDDGAVAYAGSLQELAAFAAELHATVNGRVPEGRAAANGGAT